MLGHLLPLWISQISSLTSKYCCVFHSKTFICLSPTRIVNLYFALFSTINVQATNGYQGAKKKKKRKKEGKEYSTMNTMDKVLKTFSTFFPNTIFFYKNRDMDTVKQGSSTRFISKPSLIRNIKLLTDLHAHKRSPVSICKVLWSCGKQCYCWTCVYTACDALTRRSYLESN